MGASDDIFHMRLNAYKTLVEESRLASADRPTATLTRFDQLFVALTAKSEVARALSRPEWLICLIQFALMRRVHNEETDSVEHALRQLIDVDMKPAVDRRALHDANAFRELMYTQAVTQDGLVDWEPQLRQVFNEYAKGDGAIGDELHSKYLLEFAEWKNMLRDLKIIGEDITPREVAMTFVWARLRVCNVRDLESQVREASAAFPLHAYASPLHRPPAPASPPCRSHRARKGVALP